MIDWTKQHCGVLRAPFNFVLLLMPDLTEILESFPDDPFKFTWDVKVHMLLPRQYPCIPNWHCDNVPRVNGIQKFDRVTEDPMYCWISGPPLTQFKHGYLEAQTWHRFTQKDEHRGTAASDFCWRGFIRASHVNIMPPNKGDTCSDFQRRHCQVYLNADSYQW